MYNGITNFQECSEWSGVFIQSGCHIDKLLYVSSFVAREKFPCFKKKLIEGPQTIQNHFSLILLSFPEVSTIYLKNNELVEFNRSGY